ncbi:MAG: TonB-dependent receptor plug domain-containing protein [Sphingomicrobium sp.]
MTLCRLSGAGLTRAKTRLIASSMLLLPLMIHSASHAAQPGVAIVGAGRTYSPAEFARFAPRTALDMVQLIPGFVIADSEDRRGLGATSANVLIDGRPVSGKANDAIDALSRITAAEVQRIEVKTSTSSDTAGVGRQIADVILVSASEGTKGQFSWRPSTRLRDRDIAWLNGETSISGQRGGLEYTVGIRNTALRTGASGPSRVSNAAGDLIELRDEIFVERSDRPRIGADLRYEAPSGMIVALRGSYQRFIYRFRERSERSGNNLVDRTRFLTQREKDRRYELGGDVQFGVGPGRLKLIGLHSAERSPIDTRVRTDFSDGSGSFGNRFVTNGDLRETIFRSEYRWTGNTTDWLISAERAVNRLDNLSSLFGLLPDGSFEKLPFPGGSGDVRERRYEGAITMSRRLFPQLTLQGSLGGEISRLRLAGDLGSDRTFRRPKGYVSLGWRPSEVLRVTAKIGRRVGQIDFIDFLGSRDLLEDRENASNAQLVPPQSWDVEAEFRRELGAFGSTSLRLYGQRIEDLIEQIPVGGAGEAPGNLDTAYLYGADWKTSLLLDRLGWAGGRLDGRFQFQESSVDDPVTGRSRRISNNLVRLIEVSLRHDIPATDWAWGAGLFHIHRAPNFRLGELARFRQGPLSGNVYVENKDVAGLTVRAALSNLISSGQDLDRFLFDGRRGGTLQSIERRRRSVGPVLSLSVSGNF